MGGWGGSRRRWLAGSHAWVGFFAPSPTHGGACAIAPLPRCGACTRPARAKWSAEEPRVRLEPKGHDRISIARLERRAQTPAFWGRLTTTGRSCRASAPRNELRAQAAPAAEVNAPSRPAADQWNVDVRLQVSKGVPLLTSPAKKTNPTARSPRAAGEACPSARPTCRLKIPSSVKSSGKPPLSGLDKKKKKKKQKPPKKLPRQKNGFYQPSTSSFRGCLNAANPRPARWSAARWRASTRRKRIECPALKKVGALGVPAVPWFADTWWHAKNARSTPSHHLDGG